MSALVPVSSRIELGGNRVNRPNIPRTVNTKARYFGCIILSLTYGFSLSMHSGGRKGNAFTPPLLTPYYFPMDVGEKMAFFQICVNRGEPSITSTRGAFVSNPFIQLGISPLFWNAIFAKKGLVASYKIVLPISILKSIGLISII